MAILDLKFSHLKFMLSETVRARTLKYGMNLPYIIAQLRMQYKNLTPTILELWDFNFGYMAQKWPKITSFLLRNRSFLRKKNFFRSDLVEGIAVVILSHHSCL